jgi:hypothetical protein
MKIDNKLKWDYSQMQLMFCNYRLFILNYAVKIKKPDIPDMAAIQKANDELRDLYVQFKDMVETSQLATELKAYLLNKNDNLKNEIFAILEKIAQEHGTGLNFMIPQKRSYYPYSFTQNNNNSI